MILKFININYKHILFSAFLIFLTLNFTVESRSEENFNEWLKNYKKYALKNNISQVTIDKAFKNVKFLEQVIKYDRKQPEFFEDTITYVNKRANSLRTKKAKKLLIENKKLFNNVENNFSVEKEILLALWGIETNFGKHVGKMDIISCLATLSFDKRRSEFFSKQLLTLLKLIDRELIDPSILFGSWAGAYGNFQFMPSTINNYAIDYDGNNKIDLKLSLPDALASAANYINKIGWKKNQPCFFRVKLTKKVNKKFLNKSARTISNRLKISKWKNKGVVSYDGTPLETNLKSALIIPDGDENSPAYLVFQNYEKILKWNRSLRFGISVCTLANMIKT
jgi:membrane-bound lytic murein transglycosylase B